MIPSPIALFCYKRLSHLQAVLESLRRNELAEQSDLFIFSDGPKDEAAAGEVKKIRSYLRTIRGFKKVHICEQSSNLGLSRSIRNGVQSVLAERGRVIVVEDDLVTAPFFLRFLNDALNLYENNERVASAHAYCYPLKGKIPETFFFRGTDCWGWATWTRGWSIFEPDAKVLLSEIKRRGLENAFTLNGAAPFLQLLESQAKGTVDSWSIRWQASAFLKDMYTLYPGRSLVQNNGFDGSGVHSGESNRWDTPLSDRPIRVAEIPVREERHISRALEIFWRGGVAPPGRIHSGVRRLARGIKRLVRGVRAA